MGVACRWDLYEELKHAETSISTKKWSLKTTEQMRAVARTVGANAFICSSAKTGIGVTSCDLRGGECCLRSQC